MTPLSLVRRVRLRVVTVYVALLAALLLGLWLQRRRRRDAASRRARTPPPPSSPLRQTPLQQKQRSALRASAREEAFVRYAAPLCAADDAAVASNVTTMTTTSTSDTPSAAAMARARACFPRKHEQHDHVVVVRLPAGVSVTAFAPLARAFAACFAPAGSVDVVLCDVDGIAGELRQPQLRLLYASPHAGHACAARVRACALRRYAEQRCLPRTYNVADDDDVDNDGDNDGRNGHDHTRVGVAAVPRARAGDDAALEALLTRCMRACTYTTHTERGVVYGFDAARVMFCSGNTTERMHFATIAAVDEVVVDMFAGIGYFTLPLAMHGGVAVVHALEKNAESVAHLRLNALLNGVARRVCVWAGDNRSHVSDALRGACDRVIMGYIPCCRDFLPRAVSFLRGSDAGAPRGVVHYHFLSPKATARQTLHAHLATALTDDAVVARASVRQLRCVKSYAPQRYHFVADVHFA